MIMDPEKMMEGARIEGVDSAPEEPEHPDHAEQVAKSFKQFVDQNPLIDEAVMVYADGQNVGIANHIGSNVGRVIASVVAKAMEWMMKRTADTKGNVG